jgi:antitoxin component YwqK of YwqJK toxin-antitoxin module
VQVEFNKLSNISINEVIFKTYQSEEEIKEQEKKIVREKEDKNKKEKELIEKLRTILNLMKDLFEFINDADLALTYEMLDDKNSGFDKRILGFNAKVIAFLKKTKWPSLFVLVVGLTSYLLTSHPVFLIYIIGLIVSAVITAFLWSKHLHNDEGTSGFESKTGYFMPLKYGKISGKVTSKHPNGEIKSEANWIDGKQEGLETQWYDNGEKKSETNYVNGKREGLQTWWINGKIMAEDNFKDGKRVTESLWGWHENGEKADEDNFKDGKREGLTIHWHENGQKCFEFNYIDGKEEGLATWWHENGEKSTEVNYIDGKEEGLKIQWHENGEKGAETNYVNGKQEGLHTWWHENGEKSAEVNFKNNERHGSRTFWDKDGNVTLSGTYENGESNNQNGLEPQYDDQGALTHYIEYKDGVVVNERVENKE